MLEPERLFSILRLQGVDFFTGVPDSLLRDFCAYVADHAPASNHVIAANEGSAMAIAAGYHLATGRVPLVYLQNSGVGNLINPLLSLADPEVYGLQALILIGWRGEPGLHDEPQHVKQGRIMLAMLDAMETPYRVLARSEPDAAGDVGWAMGAARERPGPAALIVRRGTFSRYTLQHDEPSPFSMRREEAIEIVAAGLAPDAIVVSTTGMISRELFEIRRRRNEPAGRDFLTVGSMGHASAIACGIALQKRDRPVLCLDGDGALLMHMGALAVQGQMAPRNFKHVVLNNGCHDSVGAQPTVAFKIRLGEVARACGYAVLDPVSEPETLRRAVAELVRRPGPALLEVRVRKGAREDLGRPTTTPQENKRVFMKRLTRGT
jgi:phosphonopyruvate decarboxylase